ncbi:DUF1772 domain-containing protein (plasmid) [Salinigranum rubrum]|uniref:DUF1772 domain-containing protein n=2 Tax=Salinigranum rubrum TaxID=755307 RepID=A0A2I8VQ78_9EURY|nr:DUF1772 domain-containing protein [Salinigranum rubrum]
MAGLFFAYSVSVVLTLDTLSASSYTRVMQSINEEILNPLFGVSFGGAIIVPTVGAFLVFIEGLWTALFGQLFLAGTVIYLVGTAGVTLLVSVPMNNTIAGWSIESPPTGWEEVRARWKRWNHVRTVAAFISFVLYVVATLSLSASFVEPF